MKKIITLFLSPILIICCVACDTGDTPVETVDFANGIIDGNNYISQFGGIIFSAPTGYEYFTKEMIEEAFSITTDTLAIDTITSTIYDMYCYNEASRSSINVNFENLLMTHGADFTEEEYIDDCMTNYTITFNSFEDIFLQSIEKSTVSIDGTNYNCINMVLNNDGEEFFDSLIIKKVGNYMMHCTVVAYTQAEMDNIISNISEI